MYLLSVQKQEDFETRLCLLPEQHRAAELSSFAFRSFFCLFKLRFEFVRSGPGGSERPERQLCSVLLSLSAIRAALSRAHAPSAAQFSFPQRGAEANLMC